MATITELRQGIADNLSSINGLRVSATIPENPNPPVAIIAPNGVDYDTTMGRGLDQFTFNVTVIVGRADGRSAQNTLDAYCASSGTQSIKSAIELDRSLGSKANDLRVTGLSNYGSLTIGEATYLAAEWSVTVYA